jgi:glutamine synthetase type III
LSSSSGSNLAAGSSDISQASSFPKDAIRDLYGVNVFGMQQMRDTLPAHVITALDEARVHLRPIGEDVADSVARALLRWALDRGVR